MIMETKCPDEVKAAFEGFVQYLNMLANDQHGARRWQTTQKAKRECDIRADTYLSIVADIREMEFRHERDPVLDEKMPRSDGPDLPEWMQS